MFAGIHQIILDEEQSQVMGIASKEGEEVGVYCLSWELFFFLLY